jgi:Methylamine utilisation protein MauE
MKISGKTLIAYILGLVVATIWGIASFYKAGDPGLFFDQITAHKVTPESWSPVVAYFFIIVELLAAAAFIAFIWPRLVFAGSILMMLGFIGVTAWAWAHGNAEDCGCFGRLMTRGPLAVIIEDSIVILISIVGIRLTGGFKTKGWQWFVGIPLIVIVVLLTIFGPTLPMDGLIVGIRPGSDLSDMALEGNPIALDEGTVLIALIGPDCSLCDEGIDELKQIKAGDNAPQVLAAFSGTRGEAQAWRMKNRTNLPNFPIATASPRVLRQYYRRFPATFLLSDGIVVETWWDRIPPAASVKSALATQ